MMATEPEWRRRFEREAMTIAALNHPGIVTIHSVETDGPTPFLTMELVEGRALRDAIPGNGLPLDMLLKTAIAVIDAVAAAHHRGVVHRDLKPANVMLCPDGRVKVLDFGLAKVHDAEAAANGEASTRLPTDVLTGEGRIVGTVAYMSPEQAEGKPVDQRSDIFSLGILLYEMATGQRPFTGDTGISILSSIIKDTPPAITDVRPDLPPPLARIVRRCLIKDPLRRYQAARDLQTDLEDLKQDVDSGVLSAPVSARIAQPASVWRVPRKAAYFIAGGFVLLAAGAAWFAAARYLGAPAPFTATEFQRLTDSGVAALVAISPDGRYVVYVQRPHGEAKLWIRQTAVGSTIQILPSTNGRFAGLAFSPDGNFVYYTLYPAAATVAALYKIPTLGGAPVRVLENVDSAASFSPDGSQVSFIRGQPTEGKQLLMIARADGSSPRALVVSEAPWLFEHQSAPWSPDGRTIIATTRDADIGAKSRLVSVDVASGRVTPLGRDWDDVDDAAWMPDGRSVVTTAAEATPYAHWQIWQVSWPAGERRALTSGLNEYERVSVAGDGRTIATIEGEFNANLWTQSLAGGEGRQLTQNQRETVAESGLDWTPDGRLVCATFSGSDNRPHVWIMDADGSHAQQLTTMLSAWPAASPDGKWIYFNGGTTTSVIWKLPVEGGEPVQVTTDRLPADPERRWRVALFHAVAEHPQSRDETLARQRRRHAVDRARGSLRGHTAVAGRPPALRIRSQSRGTPPAGGDSAGRRRPGRVPRKRTDKRRSAARRQRLALRRHSQRCERVVCETARGTGTRTTARRSRTGSHDSVGRLARHTDARLRSRPDDRGRRPHQSQVTVLRHTNATAICGRLETIGGLSCAVGSLPG
jgi:Tol biopolymer transport system component